MALNKIIKEDKIEIVGDYKAVQVRTATVIEEDGVELSRSFHRHVVHPGDDLSEQSAEVQAICNAVHTPELIADWEAHLTSQQEQMVNEESSDDSNSGE
tara:strand:+ start:1006 stop:1302 length:297 start_codon:yes stop_codon:yes gene_type:complete